MLSGDIKMKISEKFSQLNNVGKKAFIAYIPFGFPRIEYTTKIIFALQEVVDVIELGIPFSDPVADGPIIQAATARALAEGADTDKLFSLLCEIKDRIKVPLVLMTYYNPVFRYGMDRFFHNMQKADVSGIMIVDLPWEESGEYIKKAQVFCLEPVSFVTPTTSYERMKKIVSKSKGFIYYISITGITGPGDIDCLAGAIAVKYLKSITKLPICMGFGIHTKDQVEQVNNFCDGVIVGSSIVKFVADNYNKEKFPDKLKKYVNSLKP